MSIVYILDRLHSTLINIEKANELLKPKGYILKDVFNSGHFYLYPLNSREMN